MVKKLSKREFEVLELIAQGMSNRKIGERLGLTYGTAQGLVHRLYVKLGFGNRIKAAMYYYQNYPGKPLD